MKAIPNQRRFPGLDAGDLGLVPIAIDVHAGFVFINLDPQPALSIRAFLGAIAAAGGVAGEGYPTAETRHRWRYSPI